MADYKFIRVEAEGGLYIITINRPERRNALHPAASEELSVAFDVFRDGAEHRVAIITGAGDAAFCAGNDLKSQAELGDKYGSHPSTGFGGLSARFDIEKPLIAAVNGFAMGGGLELALACDVIIGADDALVALPEPRVGLAALGGGLHRLPRMIPMKKAMGMILTGRHVEAKEAYEMGLFTAIAPRSGVLEEAKRWAGMMLECSPASLRASKKIVSESLEVGGVEAAIARRYDAISEMRAGPDFVEGPRAFAEKRKPNWA